MHSFTVSIVAAAALGGVVYGLQSLQQQNQEVFQLSTHMDSKVVMTIALSGATSTGKTTFIALLLEVFQRHAPVPIVYINEDAFFKEVDELPLVDRIPDNDALESVHIPDMQETIHFVQRYRVTPDTYKPYPFIGPAIEQARRSLSPELVLNLSKQLNDADINRARHKVLFFVEGFLLYHSKPHTKMIKQFFDHRVFLLASYAVAKRRRLQRYIDRPLPPDSPNHFATEAYFDKFVWGHYVEYHKYLFNGGDGKDSPIFKGNLDRTQARQEFGIDVPGEPDLDLGTTLKWAFNETLEFLSTTT